MRQKSRWGYCSQYPPSSYGPVLVGSLVFYLLLKAVKLRHQHKQRDLNMLCLFDSRSSDQLQFSFYANIRCPNQVMMEYFLANRNFTLGFHEVQIICRSLFQVKQYIIIYVVSVVESQVSQAKFNKSWLSSLKAFLIHFLMQSLRKLCICIFT